VTHVLLVTGRLVAVLSDLEVFRANRTVTLHHALVQREFDCAAHLASHVLDLRFTGSCRLDRPVLLLILANTSQIEVRPPFLPRVLEKILPISRLSLMLFDVVETDEQLVVGELTVQSFTLVATAGKDRVQNKDGNTEEHENRVHDGPEEADVIEVGGEVFSVSFRFCSCVPGLDKEKRCTVDSNVDCPFQDGG